MGLISTCVVKKYGDGDTKTQDHAKSMPMVLISDRDTKTKTMPKASKTNPTKIMTGLSFSSWFVNNWKKIHLF